MTWLFDTFGFPARWNCGSAWTALHGYTHIIADVLVFAAYMTIPLVIVYFVRQRNDIPFPRIAWLFALFIFACGTTHLLDAIMFYWPAYRLQAVAKVITAAASWATIFALAQVLPKALALPGQLKLSEQLRNEIAERKRSEDAARKSAEFTRAVLDSLPEAIAVLDPDGDILAVNENWRVQSRILADQRPNAERSTISGQSYLVASGVVFPTDPHSEQEVTARLSRLLRDGKAFSAEYRTDVGDAKPGRWILMRATPLKTERGGAVISHHDITGRKQVEDALVEARAAADAASEAKSRFLANMSHEIRTPMTAVLGYADLLGGELTNPEHLNSVELLRRHGQFLLEILDDILDLSKIEAGKLEVEPVECDISPLIADLQSLMNVRASEKGIELAVDYAGPVPAVVRTDAIRLRQILMNLVGNAIKFTDEGSVRVSVKYLPDGRIPAADRSERAITGESQFNIPTIPTHGSGMLLFKVSDTGIGMLPQQMEQLFQAFTQADASTTRKYGGTGLGLAICKSLTHMLGGEIWAESTRGRGSVFYVTIACDVGRPVPLVNPVSPSADSNILVSSAPPPIARLDSTRILLAEDTPGLRHLVSRILTIAGAEVELVTNGLEAVEAVERSAVSGRGFDVVLMDVQMPVMNGSDATRQLRKSGYTIPIIALTAGAMAGDREKCLAAGCDAYVPKPIDRGELLRTIAALSAHRSDAVIQ